MLNKTLSPAYPPFFNYCYLNPVLRDISLLCGITKASPGVAPVEDKKRNSLAEHFYPDVISNKKIPAETFCFCRDE